MENKSKLNTILLIIIITLLVVGLAYFFFSNSKQAERNKDIIDNNQNIDNKTQQSGNNTLVEDIYKSMSSYENKSVTIEGYVYREDIASETISGNLYINMRNVPDMEKNNGTFSIKMDSENMRNMLINKYYSDNSQWIKIKVTGILHSIILPMNGTSGKSMYMQVNTLNVE